MHTNLTGVIDCRSRLSLTPDVTLVLSPPNAIAQPSLHPCVRLSRWAKSPGTLSFIPPDGPFRLLEYETPEIVAVDLPIRIEGKVEDTGEFEIRLTPSGTKFDDLLVSMALNPTITGTVNTRPSKGDFSILSDTLIWTIPNDKSSAGVLGGGRPGYVLRGQFSGHENMMPPCDITVEYSCEGWLASGITVSGLRVSGAAVAEGGRGGQGIFKGVKGITKVQIVARL
jgi:AP-3 complex subunit mu